MNKSFIVVGLAFGDESKGSIVDFLTRKYSSNLTIRFSGGSQCAHNVIDDQNHHHTFSQFGAGSLAGARTLLAKHVLINPLNLMREGAKLSQLIDNPYRNLYIDENAVIITPYHQIVNQLLELNKREKNHGSCGHGVWEARLDAINNPDTVMRAKDLKKPCYELYNKLQATHNRMHQKLSNQKMYIPYEEILSRDPYHFANQYESLRDELNIINNEQITDLINKSINPVFEGNQGILLDDIHGFFPYVTANSTTSKHALELLKECNWAGETEVIGVTRTYATRHGAGPFATEDPYLSTILSDDFNKFNQWQENFRFGWLNSHLLHYAIKVDGNIDTLAVSHIDDLKKLDKWKISYYDGDNSCPYYQEHKKEHIIDIIKLELDKQIKIESFGPKSNQKKIKL